MRNSTQAPASAGLHPTQQFAANPLAQLALAFALGVLGALFLVLPLAGVLCFAGVTTLLAGAAVLKSKLRIATNLVMASALFLGASFASIEKSRVPANQLKRLVSEGAVAVGEPLEITGALERDPEIGPQSLYLNLRVEKIRQKTSEREASGIVELVAAVSNKATQREFDQLDLRYGARIRVMTILERAESFRNPGVSPFTEYLDLKGYDATAFVKSPLLIERLENERVFLPLAWLYEWRRKLQAQIDSHFSNETAGVLDAALIGNRYNLSRQTSERFREGGTFHVLVISGLHITFLGGLIFLLTRRFTKNRALQFLLSVSVVWAYSLAVGAEASVIRAALMFTFVLLAPLLSRRSSSLNALGAAALDPGRGLSTHQPDKAGVTS